MGVFYSKTPRIQSQRRTRIMENSYFKPCPGFPLLITKDEVNMTMKEMKTDLFLTTDTFIKRICEDRVRNWTKRMDVTAPDVWPQFVQTRASILAANGHWPEEIPREGALEVFRASGN
ncbi:hypothetical protein CAEBREN_24107 [Caenorhabditis brenneri]|uniref:Uncharacterized protein n=1 Tax=Caenorhabditis brenneri TaxID=135651 RepID=G0NEU8_CAEBE|nr:hypothetical protein CAEBREN_24107 [Caenorhabditis brenneri]